MSLPSELIRSQYLPEFKTFAEPNSVQVALLNPNDPLIIENVFPMIDCSFARYTNKQDGRNGTDKLLQLSMDRYDLPGKSWVVTATDKQRVLGAFRIVDGNAMSDTVPGIDAMQLMVSDLWQHIPNKRFGEFGRFVVNKELGNEEQIRVLQNLYSQAVEFAAYRGFADHIYVILADHVRRFVASAGIGTELIADGQLNEADPEASHLFDQYPRYWRPHIYPEYYRNGTTPGLPKLYRFIPEIAY